MGTLDHIDPGNSGGSVLIPEIKKIPPRPITYECADCGQEFVNVENLREHRLEEHRIQRPYLYLSRSAQHLARYVISQTITPSDLLFSDVDRIDIGSSEYSSLEGAARYICANQVGRIEITLWNGGYSAEYLLDFDIISDDVAAQVERAFIECNQISSSQLERLGLFYERIQKLDASALGYATALDRYMVGIMAKDRVANCPVPYEKYPDKLGESLDRLSHIHRPFSAVLVSIIHLIQNCFEPSLLDDSFPLLASANRAFREGIFSTMEPGCESSDNVPIDTVTDLAISFAIRGDDYRHANCQELENLVRSNSLSESDRLKIRLLLMAWYAQCKDEIKAREQYSKIRHTKQVSSYAQTIYEKFMS